MGTEAVVAIIICCLIFGFVSGWVLSRGEGVVALNPFEKRLLHYAAVNLSRTPAKWTPEELAVLDNLAKRFEGEG